MPSTAHNTPVANGRPTDDRQPQMLAPSLPPLGGVSSMKMMVTVFSSFLVHFLYQQDLPHEWHPRLGWLTCVLIDDFHIL